MKRILQSLIALLLIAQPALAQDELSGTPIGVPSVDYSTGFASTTVNGPNDVFDGSFDTYFAAYQRSFGWVGLDLGTKHVITKVAFAPRAGWGSRLVLGLFEGANNEDFSDALPLHIIKSAPQEGVYTEATVACSRGFRYVRYVGPADARCNIAELKFYGHEGEGNDDQLYLLSGQPVVTIHTQDAEDITSKAYYLNGYVSVIAADRTTIVSDTLRVRGRGNGSWTFPQKPYKMKLAHKHKLLGGPAKAKDWTLINNYRDKTLIRNMIGFHASRKFNAVYTPAATLVDVILNGEYKGSYMLCDQVEVKKHRIPVTEMNDSDVVMPNLSGGYLIEVDAYAGSEPAKFYSAKYNTPVTIKSPDSDLIQPEQIGYITDTFNDLEERLFSRNYRHPEKGYRKVLDVDDFLKRFLVMEFVGNTDSYFSMHMYKERGEDQFHCAPVWDMDLTFDNDTRTYPINDMNTFVSLSGKASIVAGMAEWIKRILGDGADDTRRLWAEAKANGFTEPDVQAFVDSITWAIQDHQALHFTRWPILNTYVAFNTGARGSHQAEVDHVKQYIAKRFEWLDEHIAALEQVPDEEMELECTILGGKGCIGLQTNINKTNVQVRDLDGKAVYETTTQAGRLDIPLASGLYQVAVTTPQKQGVNRNVVVSAVLDSLPSFAYGNINRGQQLGADDLQAGQKVVLGVVQSVYNSFPNGEGYVQSAQAVYTNTWDAISALKVDAGLTMDNVFQLVQADPQTYLDYSDIPSFYLKHLESGQYISCPQDKYSGLGTLAEATSFCAFDNWPNISYNTWGIGNERSLRFLHVEDGTPYWFGLVYDYGATGYANFDNATQYANVYLAVVGNQGAEMLDSLVQTIGTKTYPVGKLPGCYPAKYTLPFTRAVRDARETLLIDPMDDAYDMAIYCALDDLIKAYDAVEQSRIPMPDFEIVITPDTLRLVLGETGQLTVSFTPDNMGEAVQAWASSQPQVAAVDSTGLVKAVGVGEATMQLTTKYGNTATSIVRVQEFPDGVDAATGSGLSVRVQGRTLVIESDVAATLRLVTAAGQSQQLRVKPGSNRFDLQPGIYLINNRKYHVR